MRKGWMLAIGLGVLSWSAGASAEGIYKQYIPNAAVFDCDTCHIPDDPQDARNVFGQTIEALVAANAPEETWWDEVKNEDADGDGQTNAEELGDPCLEWTVAVPAGRTFDISNPGDPLSLSASPDVCEDPPMPGEGGGGDGSGSGMGNGMGNGMGSGSGDGMGGGEGGAEPVETNSNDRPADPDFTVAEPSGCATGGGTDPDASWLALLGLALLLRGRRD